MQPPSANEYFHQLTPAARARWLANYHRALHDEQHPPPRHIPMPWMVPHWQNGRTLLVAVMEELDEQTNKNI